jgi:hypothetical protein
LTTTVAAVRTGGRGHLSFDGKGKPACVQVSSLCCVLQRWLWRRVSRLRASASTSRDAEIRRQVAIKTSAQLVSACAQTHEA